MAFDIERFRKDKGISDLFIKKNEENLEEKIKKFRENPANKHLINSLVGTHKQRQEEIKNRVPDPVKKPTLKDKIGVGTMKFLTEYAKGAESIVDLVGLLPVKPLQDFAKKDLTGDMRRLTKEVATYTGVNQDGLGMKLTGAMGNVLSMGKIAQGLRGVGNLGKVIPGSSKLPKSLRPTGADLIGLGGVSTGVSLEQALQEGEEGLKASIYALTSGAKEYANERLFGGLPFFGKGALDDVVKGSIARNVRNPLLSKTLQKGVNVVGEGAEEVLSSLGDVGIRGVMGMQQHEQNFGEDFLIGAGVSTLLGGGRTVKRGEIDTPIQPTSDKVVETPQQSPTETQKTEKQKQELPKDPTREESYQDSELLLNLIQMQDKGSNVKDFFRNLDAMAGDNRNLRDFLYERFEKPLLEGKAKYTDNLYRVIEKYKKQMDELGIKKKSKESSAVQWYGEGKRYNKDGTVEEYTIDDLKREFPNNWENIVKAEKVHRELYDEYVERINKTLENIYPDVEKKYLDKMNKLSQDSSKLHNQLKEIDRRISNGEISLQIEREKIVDKINEITKKQIELSEEYNSMELFRNKRLTPRKDYFHHFRELEEGWGAINEILKSSTDIHPDIIGRTDSTKPKSKWEGFMQRRRGDRHDADAVGGMLRYIPKAEYKIAIDPVTAQNRKTIQDMRNELKELLNKKTKDPEVHYPSLERVFTYLENFTNDLAGKTNKIDRITMENIPGGRKGLKIFSWINNRVKSNAVVGNLNSAISQFLNLPNATAYIGNPKDWSSGLALMLKDKNLINKSVFMRERYSDKLIKQFNEGIISDLEKFASWVLTFGDKKSATLIWYSAYSKYNRLKGNVEGFRKYENAVDYADDITRRSVYGRGIGEESLLQKSELTQLLIPFTKEVQNGMLVMTESIKKKDAMAIVRIITASFILNRIIDGIGGNPMAQFDFIDAVLRNVSDDEKEFDEKLRGTFTSMFGEVLESIPGGALLGSAVVGGKDEQAKQLFGSADPTRFGTGQIALNAIATPFVQMFSGQTPDFKTAALSILPRFGGKQIDRTTDSILNYYREIPGSYSKSGRFRYEMPTEPLEILKVLTLGEYSTKEAKEYFAKGYMPLTEKQYEEFKSLNIPMSEYRAYLNTLKGLNEIESDKDEKGNPISGSASAKKAYLVMGNKKMSSNEKNYLLNKISEGTKESDLNNLTLDPRTYGYYFSLNKEGREKFLNAIQEYGFNDIQYVSIRKKIQDIEKTSSGILNQEDRSNYKKGAIIEILLREDLNDKQKAYIYSSYYSSDEKLNTVVNSKIPMDIYLEFENMIKDIKAIDDPKSDVAGKVINGSKKAQVVKVIEKLKTSKINKLLLYGMQGYALTPKEKTEIFNYVNNLKLTTKEKKDIIKQISSFQWLENGKLRGW